MASAATLPKLIRFRPRCHSHFQVIDPVHVHFKKNCNACKCHIPAHGLLVSSARSHPVLPVLAVGSGRESSVTEEERKSGLSLQNAKTSVVSRDDEKINVRVDLPGKVTQKVFDEALTSLARDAPPVPGFRKSKGGRTSNIPSSILLQMLGKSRVTKFVLQEILSITVGDFVKKENLKVNPEIKTTQSEGELESSFTPGSAFSFNVILQLEKPESDEASENSESDNASDEEPSS
uniref:peptidylprolyl isomerase n=1 Tax=Leersia perrieri TaxID=77586 RepID=A0A0D9V8X3_9ORYZ